MEQTNLKDTIQRHTLLFLTCGGIQYAWAYQYAAYPSRKALEPHRDLLNIIPVIARRTCDARGFVPIGVSFPVRKDGVRWKMGSCVSGNEVAKVITSEEAALRCADADLVSSAMLKELLPMAKQAGIGLGVFGSTAMAAVTGLPYLHDASDLDLVLTPEPGARLGALGEALSLFEIKYRIHVDAEVALGEGYYGKLKELLSGSQTILAKGGEKPVLLSSRAIRDKFVWSAEID